MKKFLIASIILVWGLSAHAAPSISGVSGTVSNGQSITISGSAFGTGPNVVLFDDFEKGTNGQNISTSVGGAQVGQWNEIEGSNYPKYSNANALSGSLAFRANMSAYWLENVASNLPASTKKVFISWWTLIPSGTVLPGTGDGAGINWKNVWLQGSGTTDDDLVIPLFQGEDSLSIQSNSLPYSKYFESQFSIGTWKRFAVYVDGGTGSNGAFHFWELTTSGVSQRINDNGVAILDASGYFEQVRINGYGRVTSSCYPTFDDVYIATGDNARARVEIGNSATYANCTKLTVVTPTSWSASSITAKVWRGQFGPTESAYLFVIDSTGAVSSGYAITFGDTPPTMSGATCSGCSLNVP